MCVVVVSNWVWPYYTNIIAFSVNLYACDEVGDQLCCSVLY